MLSSTAAHTGNRDIQLARFEVRGLFGQLDHDISFPTPTEGRSVPSLTILHGPNGVGKTTILRMIDGILRLDFNPCRAVPFTECRLYFTTGDSVSVHPKRDGMLQSLVVRYTDFEVELDPQEPGALRVEDRHLVEKFRRTFFRATYSLNFDLVETTRLIRGSAKRDREGDYLLSNDPFAVERHYRLRGSTTNPKARAREYSPDLAMRVQRFVREAQVNYRRFFSTDEPDLFPKILHRLADANPKKVRAEDLLRTLRRIRQEDDEARQLGLEPDQWDYEQLAGFLEERKDSVQIEHALTVLSAYVETLESRAAQRQLVVKRLRAFEKLMSEFFENKDVRIHPVEGFVITTSQGEDLSESHLSTGEYNLLYLMVSALVTYRRGTVIAIDEPELSMHLKWQRRLIGALTECASNAEPQFVFATHSPDIAAEYPDAMMMLRLPE